MTSSPSTPVAPVRRSFASPHMVLTAVLLRLLIGTAVVAVAISRSGTHARSSTSAAAPGAATGLLPSGRQLTPQGAQVTLGNFPTGGAVTADGQFLWTVSAGFSSNDLRIVDTVHRRVCQTLSLPGASGGIALDSVHRLAYVSGLANPHPRWLRRLFIKDHVECERQPDTIGDKPGHIPLGDSGHACSAGEDRAGGSRLPHCLDGHGPPGQREQRRLEGVLRQMPGGARHLR